MTTQEEEVRALLATEDLMRSLTDRERLVLSLRFGGGKTLREVADMFCRTPGRIRQIEAKAIRKLRHATRIRALQEALNA